MSQVIGEEFGTPDVTDFISDFDPRYDWLANLLNEYLTYVGGPEYTGLGDDREYLPEEVQEIRNLLSALEAGEEIDVDLIRNDYPLLADYIENQYTGNVPESLADRVLQGDANAIFDVLIDEVGMSEQEARELLDSVFGRPFGDPTNQNAVTLEGILSRAGYYVEGGILRLPDDGSAQAVDTDGDGVLDTAVIERTGSNGEVVQVPVYGASSVDAQIEADQEKYNNIINQEGWDDLDDFEKNRILTQSGYNPIFGDGSLEDPDLDAAINDIYQDVLDRDPDPEGDEYWVNIWESGSVTDQDDDGDVDYDDLRVLIEQAAQPELDQRDQEQQSLIDAIKDKFPTWDKIWENVQSQLPSNPQEWGDVIRSVIEAAGIDLPDSNIWEILNGGYGVVWNPGGISGLPSGVGAIVQSGNIFIPGIPVGLPPSSTIISTIGDLVNAENPIDVLIQRATDILGDVVNDPSALINQIITDELDLPTDIWDIILGGAAVTQELLDWLSENGFSTEDNGSVVPPVGGEEDEEEDAVNLTGDPTYLPSDGDPLLDGVDSTATTTTTTTNDRDEDYQETSLFDDTTDDDTTDDDTTADDTTGVYTVVTDNALFGDGTTVDDAVTDDTVTDDTVTDDTVTDDTVTDDTVTDDTTSNYTVVTDNALFGDGTTVDDTTVDDTTVDDTTVDDTTIDDTTSNYTIVQDDSLFGGETTTVDDTTDDDTDTNYTVVQDDSLFNGGTTTVDDTATVDDTTTNYTIVQDDSLFGGGTNTNTTTDFTEDFLNSTNTNITNTDNTADTTGGNYTIVDEGSFFNDNTTTNTTTDYSEDFSEPAGSTNFTESTDTTSNGQSTDFSEDPYNPVDDTIILTGGEFEEDFYNPNNTETLTDVISDSGGGGGGGASFGGSDPSMFRQGLSYQLFSPQPIISGPQTNYAQGLLGGSSNQIRRTDTPVSMSLFGEYFS